MTDAAHNRHSESRRPSDRHRIVTTGPSRFQPARPEVGNCPLPGTRSGCLGLGRRPRADYSAMASSTTSKLICGIRSISGMLTPSMISAPPAAADSPGLGFDLHQDPTGNTVLHAVKHWLATQIGTREITREIRVEVYAASP